MGRPTPVSRRNGVVRLVALGLAGVVILAAFAAPVLSGWLSPTQARATPPSASSSVQNVVVTWNGKNVSGANDPANALSISKGQTALVQFTFSGGLTADVPNVTLQLTYLGIVLTTSRAATYPLLGHPGESSSAINWSFGPLYDALEGDFEFTASLLGAHGAAVWNDSFYVNAKAPYDLESAAVIVLIILTIAELYWGIGAIRDARKAARPPQPGAKGGAAATPPAGGSSEAPSTSTAGGGDAAPPSPPGSGGSS